MSWVVWVVVIIAALLVLDLVRPFYTEDDQLFSPEERAGRPEKQAAPARP